LISKHTEFSIREKQANPNSKKEKTHFSKNLTCFELQNRKKLNLYVKYTQDPVKLVENSMVVQNK